MELIIDLLSEFFGLITELLFDRFVGICADKSRKPVQRILAALAVMLIVSGISALFIILGLSLLDSSAAGGIVSISVGVVIFAAMTVHIAVKYKKGL